MRPVVVLVAGAVFLGAFVGAGTGVVLFGTEAGPTLSAPGTETGQPQSTPIADGAHPVSANFSALYDRTVDSVAQIRVGTATGGSQGSGFLYRGRYVVTNEHVVADATSVSVQFSDGVRRTGTVVGTDVYTDLAVIEVDSLPPSAEPLPVAEQLPEQGQFVVAIGSPFGLQGTITHGIVSGVNRSMDVADGFSIPDTVQTDAPINPGNSGGPLVAMDGEVIGVNRARGGDNVGFAISAHVVDRVVPDLIADGEFDHAFVGIRSVPVTPRVAEGAGLDRATGIAVVEVLEDGPADGVLQAGTVGTEAGFEGGDVIVAVDGTPVRTHEDLNRYLLLHASPEETVTFTVYRDGEQIDVDLELGERPPA